MFRSKIMVKNCKKKVAIVTGGSSGIGKAVAFELANTGAIVVVASRNEQNGEATAKAIVDNGGHAAYIKTDVTSETQVKHLINETVKRFGRLDMAFNNAGIEQTPMPLHEITQDLYHEVMNANVKSTLFCLKYETEAMLKCGGGAIVNTSSISGAIAFATIPLYVASKHAVVGLTKSIALEFAAKNIRVNALLPGAVENTGTFTRSFGGNQASIDWAKSIHPIGRLATPEEIANVAVFLLSDKANFITGAAINADGGYTAG